MPNDYVESPPSATNGSVFSFKEPQSPTARRSPLKNKVASIDEELPLVSTAKDTKTEKKRLREDLKREGAEASTFWQILLHAKPEWCYLMIGVLACIVQGCVFPVFSLFFTNIIEVSSCADKSGCLTNHSVQIFADVDLERMRTNGHFWSMTFMLLGVVQAVTLFIQATCFGLSAERLTMRLRTKLFRHILRMDLSYFDQPKHSSGKICTRLATDTPNVKNASHRLLQGSLTSRFRPLTTGSAVCFRHSFRLAAAFSWRSTTDGRWRCW